MRFIVSFIILFSLISCRSVAKTVTNDYSAIDSVVVERRLIDTVVVTAPDAATLNALWECDSLGNVLMAEIDLMQGERLNIKPSVKYVYVEDNSGVVRRKAYFSMMAQVDSVCTLLRIQEETITKLKRENKTLSKNVQRDNNVVYIIFGGLLLFIVAWCVAKRA